LCREGIPFKGVVALILLLAIPVVMFAADDQASYKVTYDGGSLSSVTSGSGLKLFVDSNSVRITKDKTEVANIRRWEYRISQ